MNICFWWNEKLLKGQKKEREREMEGGEEAKIDENDEKWLEKVRLIEQ